MGARITGGGNTRITSSRDRGITKAGQKKKSKKKTTKQGSGDKKLADYKAKHSSTGTSKPTIKKVSEDERKANTLITSDVERANGIDRTKEAIQKINNDKAKAEFEKNGGKSPAMGGMSTMPNALPQPAPAPAPEVKPAPQAEKNDDWKNHINKDKSFVGSIKNKIDDVKSSYDKDKSFMENVKEGVESQVEKGTDKVKEKEVHVSGFSQKLMDMGKKIEDKADDYKQYAKIINPTNPMMGEIVPSVIKSGASAVGMASRVPAGAEIASQAPSSIVNAAAVAALGTIDYTVDTAKNDPVQLVSDIGVFSAMGAGVNKVTPKITPKIKPSQVLVQEGMHSNVPLEFGNTLTIGEKPIVSYVKGQGFEKGAGSAPIELINQFKDSTITAYDKVETSSFIKTVNKVNPEEGKFFESGFELAKDIHKQNKPIVEPNKFEVMSEHIPESSRPLVTDAIKSYKGEVDVYGSVTQKLQMGESFTRKPKDIEVMVDNPQNFIKHLENYVDTSQIKIKNPNGADPKIMFKHSNGEFQKGIEIFSKEIKHETVDGYAPKNDIAYGFNSKQHIKVENVDVMHLAEQGGRKLEGGHILKDGKIQPKHEGRVKDLQDLTEIGAGYASKGKISDAKVYDYAVQAAERYPEIKKSPVVEYVLENKKAPKFEEYSKLMKDSDIFVEKEILFRNSKKPMESSFLKLSNNMESSFIGSSIIGSSFVKSRPVGSSLIDSSFIKSKSTDSSFIMKPSKPSRPAKIGKTDKYSFIVPSKPSGGSSSPSSPSSVVSSPSSIGTKTDAPITSVFLNSKKPVMKIDMKMKSKKKQQKKQKDDAWKYKRTTNKYRSPLDARIKGLI